MRECLDTLNSYAKYFYNIRMNIEQQNTVIKI